MDRLEAYERRAWRLAMLLTGEEAAAELIVRRCLDAQSHPDRLPSERLDRLVIQAARRQDAATPAPPLAERGRNALAEIRRRHHATRGKIAPPAGALIQTPFSSEAMKAMHILRALPQQQREAWILQELDTAEPIMASKAMDCSRTALQRHLDLARRTMSQALGEQFSSAIAALKRDADALDPAPFINRRAEHRRRRRSIRLGVIITAVAISVIAVSIVALRTLGGAP